MAAPVKPAIESGCYCLRMAVKLRGMLFGSVLILSGSLAQTYAKPSAAEASPSLEQEQQIISQLSPREPQCTTQSCAMAEDIILRTEEVIAASQTTPMKLGGATPGNIRYAREVSRPSVIRARLRRTILAHPRQFGAVCDRLKQIASESDGSSDYAGIHTIIDLMQIAVLIDMHSRLRCLPELIALFPRIEQVDDGILGAEENLPRFTVAQSGLHANLPQPRHPRGELEGIMIGRYIAIATTALSFITGASVAQAGELSEIDRLVLEKPVPCATASCGSAQQIIDQSVEIFNESDITPMRLGGPTPGNIRYAREVTRPSAINRRLRKTLLSHPNLFPAICTRLDQIALLYNDQYESVGPYLASHLLQIALLIDTHSRQHCLPKLIAAFPETRNVNDLIEIAESYCSNAQWKSAACKQISRNPTAP